MAQSKTSWVSCVRHPAPSEIVSLEQQAPETIIPLLLSPRSDTVVTSPTYNRQLHGRSGLSAAAARGASAVAAAPAAPPTAAAACSAVAPSHAARRALSSRPAAKDGSSSEPPSESDWEGGAAGMGGGHAEGLVMPATSVEFEAREWNPSFRRTGALAMKVGLVCCPYETGVNVEGIWRACHRPPVSPRELFTLWIVAYVWQAKCSRHRCPRL